MYGCGGVRIEPTRYEALRQVVRHAEIDQVRQLRLDCRRLEDVNAQLRVRIDDQDRLIGRLAWGLTAANRHRVAGRFRRALWWVREMFLHGLDWLQEESGGEEDDVIEV